MTCPGSGENLAVEVREGIGERVASLVSTCCSGRVDMNIVFNQELFKHFARSGQEVTVAPLAPELEGTFGRSFGDRTIGDRCLDIRRDYHLQFALDAFSEADEVR